MITRIHVSDALRERLTALGFLEGTKICCLGAGPSGDPVAYEVRRTIIALRRADCDWTGTAEWRRVRKTAGSEGELRYKTVQNTSIFSLERMAVLLYNRVEF